MWFRWHNVIARELRKQHAEWSSERVFNEARKWVIATHQKIVIYDWLPRWLGTELDGYTGVWLRDYVRNGCGLIDFNGFQTVRTCNFFWRPQEPMLHRVHGGDNKDSGFVDIDRLLMGMATQLTEEEDHKIVEDLRGRVFGPLEFSRRDLMAVNIQRARDHGLPDFNTAREAYGLEPITSEEHFIHAHETIRQTLKMIYTEALGNDSKVNWYDRIDVWVGGLLETGDSPGELFSAIIRDQFTRIRDADRFWFENTKNK
ncbi:hypothetical protein B566_EDAN014120 [Ephemera danica]|nr:hypothetical protein B566_EDAN014120 [Ephemera danica]